ncbi:branched-chain amino acid ABC transporter permease [Marinibacterium sp. SX1]|uniref:branched-chain amino acid ABC transporter permease n=1 Tax=Marinibacterium sp. SX1 TaxID=3388424 RepID=UPI003D169238
MEFFLQIAANGLFVGAAYGLVGISLALIFKATGVLNLAQGEMMMITSYVAYSLGLGFDLSLIPLILLLIPVAGFFGWAIERFIMRPMVDAPMFSIVMLTLGLAFVLRGLAILVWGAAALDFGQVLSPEFVNIGFMSVQMVQVYLLAALIVASVLVAAILRFTRIGIAIRAMASNERSAVLMGIDVPKVRSFVWVLGSVISAIAGLFLASLTTLNPELWVYGFHAFPAVILGGIDAPIGGAIGGVIIGLTENLAQGYIGQGLREIAGFVVIIFVLMINPNGLFGGRSVERV